MTLSSRLTVLVMLFINTYSGSASNFKTLTIRPTESVIWDNKTEVVTCEFDSNIDRCEFLVRDDDKNEFPIIKSVTEELQLKSINTSNRCLTYKARSEPGKCVLHLHNLTGGLYVVGCRVHSLGRGWKYESMSLSVLRIAFGLKPLQIEVTDKSRLHRVGEVADLRCKTTRRTNLTTCAYLLPGDSGYINQIKANRNSTLSHGECAYNMSGVSESHNGVFWCELGNDTHIGQAAVPFVVARAPTRVILDHEHKNSYTVGDTLTATCSVQGSRPVPEIEWTLGADVIRRDATNDEPEEGWRWPWSDQNITQTVNITVTQSHFNKNLTCIVRHDYMEPIKRELLINYDGPPTVQTSPEPPTTPRTFKTTATTDKVSTTANVIDSTTKPHLPDTEASNTDGNNSVLIGAILAFVVIVAVGAILLYLYYKKRWIAPVALHTISELVENDMYQPSTGPVCTENEYDYAQLYPIPPERANIATEPEVGYSVPLNEYEELVMPVASPDMPAERAPVEYYEATNQYEDVSMWSAKK